MSLLSTTEFTATGTVLITSTPAMLCSISLSSSGAGDSVVLEVHNAGATGDVAAGNLVFKTSCNFATPGDAAPISFNLDGAMFPKGICVKATLGASGPIYLNVEYE